MTFDFVKVTIKSRFCVGSTINFVHYVNFADRKEYDVAIEVTKSALWLLEILNKKFPYKEQET